MTNLADRNTLTIVTPVYEDWPAFSQLLIDLGRHFSADTTRIEVIAIDDGSITRPEPVDLPPVIADVEILRLSINVGHQRAIAVGLVRAHERAARCVAVMDSDGEDTPAELVRMVAASRQWPDLAIVAQRRKRSEPLGFRLFYRIYRRVFVILTGQRIDFGNFSVLNGQHLDRLVHSTNIWNNYAATLIHARVPLHRLPTIRGYRYAGSSKMRFVNLVNHGLGAISVFSEAVFTRIVLGSGLVLALALSISLAVLVIRLTTTLAVPGWTTSVLGFASLLSAQAVMLPVMMGFLLLNNRATFQPLPREYAVRLIAEIVQMPRAAAEGSS